ncbi:MAG: hypothetical protein ACLFRD_12410, partial [Nitriliruptoraceae bacterium]
PTHPRRAEVAPAQPPSGPSSLATYIATARSNARAELAQRPARQPALARELPRGREDLLAGLLVPPCPSVLDRYTFCLCDTCYDTPAVPGATTS